jgi:hypothetical protein
MARKYLVKRSAMSMSMSCRVVSCRVDVENVAIRFMSTFVLLHFTGQIICRTFSRVDCRRAKNYPLRLGKQSAVDLKPQLLDDPHFSHARMKRIKRNLVVWWPNH